MRAIFKALLFFSPVREKLKLLDINLKITKKHESWNYLAISEKFSHGIIMELVSRMNEVVFKI